jgi:hypothetical protein
MPLIFNRLLNYATRGTANFPGIYIWGIMQPTQSEIEALYQRVRVDFESGECLKKNYLDRFHNLEDKKLRKRKFLPLNVGETSEDTIEKRIFDHYSGSKSGIGEAFKFTVLFDLSILPTIMYAGIQSFNINWLRKFNRKTRAVLNYPFLYNNVNIVLGYRTLLFFSHPTFIRYLFPGLILPPNWLNPKNQSQIRVITDLLPLNPANTQLKELIIQMIVSRIILKQYFRFTYARTPKDKFTKEYEAATKYALEKMGLFTIATAHDSRTFMILLAGYLPLGDTIDFDTHLRNVIFNPNNIKPLICPV